MKKIRMINLNERYVAGPESNQRFLDSQSGSLSELGDSAAMYTFRKYIHIFVCDLRNKPHFWMPCSLAQPTVSLTAEPRIADSSPSPAIYVYR